MVEVTTEMEKLLVEVKNLPAPLLETLIKVFAEKRGWETDTIKDETTPNPLRNHGANSLTVFIIHNIHTEAVHMSSGSEKTSGDRISIGGDAIGSALGRTSTVEARDINVYKSVVEQSSLDAQTKQRLKEARDAVENSGLPEKRKIAVLDDLITLTKEMEDANKDISLIQQCWARIKEFAPAVAAILAGAASIARLVSGG